MLLKLTTHNETLGTKMKKFVYLVTAIPILLFILFVYIANLPHGFSIMSEPNHPWYTPYTSAIFPYLAILFFPVTIIFDSLGIEPLGVLYMVFCGVYAFCLSYLIYFCVYKIRDKRNT